LKLRSASLLPVALILAACSSDAPGGDGSGGARNNGGASATGGAPTGGAPSGGGGTASGGGGTPSGGAAAAGGGATGATGGAPGGTGGVPATAGAAGAGTGGSSTAGAAGSGGSGGGTTPGVSHLPVPPGAGNVPKPTGAASKITTVPWAGFKGAVSYSFDDDNSSQIAHYSELKALGVHFTFFLWTNRAEAMNAVWKTALMDGHEIGNHTNSHQGAGTTTDIVAATTFINNTFKTPPYVFAAPNGDQSYPPLAKPLFFINRMVSDGLVAPNDNTDPWHLPTSIPPAGGEVNGYSYNGEVDGAVSANKWRTFCIHGFTGGNDGAYNAVDITGFLAGITHAKTTGAWLDTITAVGSYWLGEKAFNVATTMTSGTDKTYTWKLPDHFPPGRYIRVTTDGGTLKQGGTALVWDPHGYYEVALDTLSVTLSP